MNISVINSNLYAVMVNNLRMQIMSLKCASFQFVFMIHLELGFFQKPASQ